MNVMVETIALLVCRQRTSQFSKCERNRMGKLTKLLDWRREWCVPGTLWYTSFVDNPAIIPAIVNAGRKSYTWGWMLNVSGRVLYRGAQLAFCSGLQQRVWADISKVVSKGVWPSWATNYSTSQVAKTLLWGHRSMAAKCCHCILAAVFVFHDSLERH